MSDAVTYNFETEKFQTEIPNETSVLYLSTASYFGNHLLQAYASVRMTCYMDTENEFQPWGL